MIHSNPDNYANIPERYQSSAGGPPGPDAMTLARGDAGMHLASGVVARRGHHDSD